MTDEFKALRKFDAGEGREGFLYSLPALEEQRVGKISRAREEMGLERRYDAAAGIRRPRGLEGRCDFGWVVRIVVHNGHACDIVEPLEASINSAKLEKALPHRIESDTKRKSHRDRGESILDVVMTRHPQRDIAKRLSIVTDRE